MKLAKYLSLVALLVASFASQLQGQAVIAGSSGLWLESGQGAATALGCNWTDGNSTSHTYTTDIRSGAGSAKDYGKIWVAWSANGGSCGSPAAGFAWYAYISLDSGVGNRCLFAAPSCTLATVDASGTAGGNKLSTGGYTFTDTALPGAVLTAFNGASVNVSATDILPLDSLFSTYQALSPCGYLSAGTQYQGYDYGTWPGPGTPITDNYGNSFNVIGWALTGTDPLTGNAAAGTYTVTPVGATPVVVFVNTQNTSGFGSTSISNVNRAVLGLVEGNIFVNTADFIPQAYSASGNAITIFHREPLSGTYNTFERAIPDNKELYRIQEQFCPPVNPESGGRTVGSFTGSNLRAIGTGYMVGCSESPVSGVDSVSDSIGYAFWSAGNFSCAAYGPGSANTMKYLTVDGVDPLCTAYGCGGSAGEIPTSANGFLPNVTLANIANGSYPIWSELRFVTTNSSTTALASALAGYAAGFSKLGTGSTQPDFITAANLNVIHSHFQLAFVNDAFSTASEGPRVCGASSGTSESGGDAGGLVTTLQAGSDFAVIKGNYGTSSCTGINNAASFGVHQ
jgi:hypothetical protein